MSNEADHFGHRESDGVLVDLYWNRGQLKGEFRVEVIDEREGGRFVLHRSTGREAIEAFYHPFSAARAALNGKAMGGVVLEPCVSMSSQGGGRGRSRRLVPPCRQPARTSTAASLSSTTTALWRNAVTSPASCSR